MTITGHMTLKQAKAALASWSTDDPPPVRRQLMILESLQRLKRDALSRPRRSLDDALKSAMRAWKPPKRKAKPFERLGLLTATELARKLSLSTDQVARLRAKGVVRGSVVGRRMYFSLEEVQPAVAAHAVATEAARRDARVRATELQCCKCKRTLSRELFVPTMSHTTQGGKKYRYKTVSSDCRECRKEQKRERRRRKAEADGKAFVPRWDREVYEAQLRAAREEKKRQRQIAWALCCAFRKLTQKTRAEILKRIVDRQRERRHTDPAYKARRLAMKIRRERAMKDTAIEPVEHGVVAERDGWCCAICGGKVTKKNWSLDHVVPVSKGGPHTYANVVLAHRGCNSRRGPGRFPVQAPLFART